MLEQIGWLMNEPGVGLNRIWVARAYLPTFVLKGPEQAYGVLSYHQSLATLCLH